MVPPWLTARIGCPLDGALSVASRQTFFAWSLGGEFTSLPPPGFHHPRLAGGAGPLLLPVDAEYQIVGKSSTGVEKSQPFLTLLLYSPHLR